MGNVTGSYFENPYLEEGEHNPSVELVMDEARQKWRAGGWKPKKDAFEIDRKKIAGESERGKSAPSSDRFSLDIKRDLMGKGISLESLSELSYTPSYRPKGTLEKLDEATFVPMSTLQRYDVLAGELEAPPEDISFLSDAQRKAPEKEGEKKDGKLRMDTRRLEESLDSRRSEVLRMLPSAADDDTRSIIDESKRRKAREDKELGKAKPSYLTGNDRYTQLARMAKEGKKKKRRAFLDGLNIDAGDDFDVTVKTEGERLERLPEQDGMEEGTRELPEFESQTRYWSRIDSEKPTWSEVAENTVSFSPDDEDNDHAPRYIEEDLFDERAPYKEILPPRKRLRSKETGHFDTEYIREAGVDPDRIKEIMDKKYRGRWIPPEYFNDDEMVNAWFNQYNRGALSGEDYLHWAYRQRVMEQQQQQAQAMAEYQRQQAGRKPAYHNDTAGRRFPPFAQEGIAPAARQRREPDDSRLDAARREGYRRGVERDRLPREADRVRERDARRERSMDMLFGRREPRDTRYGRDDQRYVDPREVYGRYDRVIDRRREERYGRNDDRYGHYGDRYGRSGQRDDRYDRRDERYGRHYDRYGKPSDRYIGEREGRDRRERQGQAYPHRRKSW